MRSPRRSRLALLCGLVAAAPPAAAQIVGVPTRSGIAGTTIDWATLGPDGTVVPSGTTLGVGGVQVTMTTSGGGPMSRRVGPADVHVQPADRRVRAESVDARAGRVRRVPRRVPRRHVRRRPAGWLAVNGPVFAVRAAPSTVPEPATVVLSGIRLLALRGSIGRRARSRDSA